MRSIRRSLILYFLLLLALALGAVSDLAYWTAEEIVRSRQNDTAKSLRIRYDNDCRGERRKFDDALRNRARALTNKAQNSLWHAPLAALGVLTAALNPSGQTLVPLWIAEYMHKHFAAQLHRLGAADLHFNEYDQSRPGPGTEYFQVTSAWDQVWMSRSMKGNTFPVDQEKTWDAQTLLEPEFDDPEIRPGLKVRRAALLVPASHWEAAPTERSAPEACPPLLLIQVACDTTLRDGKVEFLTQEFHKDQIKLLAESKTILAELRNRLGAIALATFALCVVGGYGLVRFGLSPLRRLSHAVSQVSPKDFRLPLDKGHLPNELRPIVERLEQTLDQLRRAFAREKQAAADISHDLRTPLAALLTTIEVGLRKPRAAEEYRELLTDCHAIGRQMSQMVERLLALARLDAGVDALRPREVDAAEVAEQCAALVRPLAQARGLSLHYHAAGPVRLTTDPDKLREVLTNLLHNAVEYNRPDGRIDLALRRENGHLQLEVRDTGIGIPAETRAHIFERFFRADPSRRAEGMHAGLGLAIVKGYVDLMGGSIRVESEEGQGTTFHVELPA